MANKQIGKIRHFYDKINVAVIAVTSPLKVGDTIEIRGTATNFSQKIASMQIEHKSIKAAKKGDAIGLKVNEKVRKGDIVYKK